MENLAAIGRGLRRDGNLWRAGQAADVAYPDQFRDEMFQLEDKSFWFQHRSACIVDLVRAFPPGGPILDVGGGNGCVSHALETHGFPSVLVEPAEQGARNGLRRGLARVVCGTLEAAEFLNASVRAVGMFDVLEHVDDERALLGEIRRVLVPGGKLYLAVPAYRWLWSADDDFAGHFRRYTLRRLGGLLDRGGFRVLFASYFFSPLPLPIFFSRCVPSWLGIRRGRGGRLPVEEFQPRPSLATRALCRLLAQEREWLRRRRRLSFGSSCLVAAEKTTTPAC
jgi:SAM-dependent methyltransferase